MDNTFRDCRGLREGGTRWDTKGGCQGECIRVMFNHKKIGERWDASDQLRGYENLSLTCLGLSFSWFNNSSSTSFFLDLFIEILDLDLVCLVWLFLLSLLLYVNTNQSCWWRVGDFTYRYFLRERVREWERERERRVRKIHETIGKIRPSKSELSRNKIQRSRNNRNWSIERVEIICSGRGRLSWVTLTKV